MKLSDFSTGNVFEVLLFSFVGCLIFTYFATKIAVHTNLYDYPSLAPHKIHKKAVPYSGGMALFAVLIFFSVVFRGRLSREIFIIILSATIIFIFGLIDDFRPLNATLKLSGQLLASIVLVIGGVSSQIFSSLQLAFIPLSLALVANILLTLFWMIAITNAYNLVDSMDGLLLGLASWTIGFFLVATLDSGQWSLSVFCGILLGACLALTFFNANPAFLFMGDSGAQLIGFILAAIAILYDPQDKLQINTWFLPILLLGVPIFDTFLVIISRFRRGKPVFSGGLDHTYHRLKAIGLSEVQSVTAILLTSFLLSSLAFYAVSRPPLIANIFFGLAVLGGISAVFVFEKEALWNRAKEFIEKKKH